jgi:hypothetical protein
MKKIMLVIVFLILLTGCSNEYNLKIDKDNINEKITIIIDKSKIFDESLSPDMDIYSTDSINYLLNEDIHAILNNRNEKYVKKVDEKGNFINVTLEYTYKAESYLRAQILNNCFEKIDVKESSKDIYIHLSGKFSCLGNNNDLDFVIDSNNRVLSQNADTKKFNKYIWNINNSNKDNVDIEIKLSKKSIYAHYLSIGILSVIGLIVIIIGIVIYTKVRKRSRINEV